MNPYDELGPAWEKYKRAVGNAQRNIALIKTHKQPVLRKYRLFTAQELHSMAMSEFTSAVRGAVGEDAKLEWRHNGTSITCCVNGVMMFA